MIKASSIIRVPLTRGLFATIDAEDYQIIAAHSWHARQRHDGKGFYAANSDGVRMHRLLMGIQDDRIVDHRDEDGLHNCRLNIRAGTQSQNCINRRTTPGKYLRGARPKKGLWQAYIKYQGRQRSLGYFETEEAAHNAYLAEAGRMHGDWMPLPAGPVVTRPTLCTGGSDVS